MCPKSVYWGIGNASLAMFKRQKLSLELAQQALVIRRDMPIKYIDVSFEITLGISESRNRYAYNAYFIYSTQQASAPLLTLDKVLKVVEKNGVLLF